MMTDDNQNTYEAKILETLIKNSERLAVIETKLKVVETEVKQVKTNLKELDIKLNSKINWLFGAVFAVGASILAALYAQPILTALNN